MAKENRREREQRSTTYLQPASKPGEKTIYEIDVEKTTGERYEERGRKVTTFNT